MSCFHFENISFFRLQTTLQINQLKRKLPIYPMFWRDCLPSNWSRYQTGIYKNSINRFDRITTVLDKNSFGKERKKVLNVLSCPNHLQFFNPQVPGFFYSRHWTCNSTIMNKKIEFHVQWNLRHFIFCIILKCSKLYWEESIYLYLYTLLYMIFQIARWHSNESHQIKYRFKRPRWHHRACT